MGRAGAREAAVASVVAGRARDAGPGRSARSAADSERSLLTIAVPFAPDGTELPCAAAESQAVAARFDVDERVRRVASGRVDEVVGVLGEAAIWHLACRVEHDAMQPLASCLRLADGPLTLEAMCVPERARQRMAVASACRTQIADGTFLDDVVGFPSAMLHAGVAGVVCADGVVDDRGAMLLVLRFFDGVLDGLDPARALAEAQAWLSTATNGELGDAFGVLHGRPAHEAAEDDERWAGERPFARPGVWAAFSYSGA
jgi:CHAT domain-containing protein